jgi:hypothetical protein
MASYARASFAGVVSSRRIVMSVPAQNRVFFPQACLDQWGVEGKIELTPSELLIVAEGRRYTISEVVRVVLEVTGSPDPHGIVGKVRPKAELEKMGAEILENSMIIGDNAYDVVPGWAGRPLTSFATHLASAERAEARGGNTNPGTGPTLDEPKNDEELLRAFSEGRL